VHRQSLSLRVAVFDDPAGRSSRHVAKAQRFEEHAALETFRYRVGAQMRADFDEADSRATRDAYRAAMKAELHLLAEGIREAGVSGAALEVVASKVASLKAANDDRLYRRFGG
jgi:hypothetical protein